MPTPPIVEPKPFVKLVTAPETLMPASTPVSRAPIVRERKGWSFTHVISTTITAMPITAAVMSWPAGAAGVTGSFAAGARRAGRAMSGAMSVLDLAGCGTTPSLFVVHISTSTRDMHDVS